MKEIIEKYFDTSFIIKPYKYGTYSLFDINKQVHCNIKQIKQEFGIIFPFNSIVIEGILTDIINRKIKTSGNKNTPNYYNEKYFMSGQDLINKWESLGFLVKLELPFKEIMAFTYERCSCIIHHESPKKYNDYNVFIYAVLRRTLNNISSPDTDRLFFLHENNEIKYRKIIALNHIDIKFCLDVIHKSQKKLSKITNMFFDGLPYDIDAQTCCMISDLLTESIIFFI